MKKLFFKEKLIRLFSTEILLRIVLFLIILILIKMYFKPIIIKIEPEGRQFYHRIEHVEGRKTSAPRNRLKF